MTWTQDHDNILRRNYPGGDLGALADRLGVTLAAVKCRAHVLGLRRKKDPRRPWTKRQLSYLAQHYADQLAEDIARRVKHSVGSVYQKARQMRLYKSPEFLASCGRKAADTDGARRKREHPAIIMKRENPRKYRKWMENRSKERKETIRKEMRRVLYGMERKTRLKCIVMCKYTRRQVSHRYNALKRGYIIMDDCSEQGGERYNIYYDNETQRSSIFEKNLLKDGFQLKQWSE